MSQMHAQRDLVVPMRPDPLVACYAVLPSLLLCFITPSLVSQTTITPALAVARVLISE